MARFPRTRGRIVGRLRLVRRHLRRRLQSASPVLSRRLRGYRGQADQRLRLWRHPLRLQIHTQPEGDVIVEGREALEIVVQTLVGDTDPLKRYELKVTS